MPVRKEERLIPADRPAYRQPVLVPAKFRPPAWLRKIVPGVQILIAEELKKRPVELIAAGFPDHHDRSAVGSAVFGRVGIEVQLEFLHGVDDRIESHLAGLGLQNTDSVVEVFVGTRPASVDPRQQRPSSRQGDARGECDQGNEIAPIEGQRFELRVADVIAHRAASRFQQRCLSVHIHRLRGWPQFQLHI